jgi:transcriptional regulator with XRE-family HTH domain
MRPTRNTDRELMRALGARLRDLRKAQGRTATDVAAETGLGRRTIHRAEKGDNPTLLTLVRLLRLYGRLDELEALARPAEVSPMALIREAREERGG